MSINFLLLCLLSLKSFFFNDFFLLLIMYKIEFIKLTINYNFGIIFILIMFSLEIFRGLIFFVNETHINCSILNYVSVRFCFSQCTLIKFRNVRTQLFSFVYENPTFYLIQFANMFISLLIENYFNFSYIL